MSYDPLHAPDPATWLALEDLARIEAVDAAHKTLSLGDAKRDRLHSIVHTVVENQLASGIPPAVRATLERLMGAGVDRHEALHAIGSVMAEYMFGAMGKEEAFDVSRYEAKLGKLDPAAWRGRQGRTQR